MIDTSVRWRIYNLYNLKLFFKKNLYRFSGDKENTDGDYEKNYVVLIVPYILSRRPKI